MKLVWMTGGGLLGLLGGSLIGFAGALGAASLRVPPNDGTFGMRELLVGLPGGAVIGALVGVVLAYRHAA